MSEEIFMPSEIVFRGVDELLPFAQNSRRHDPAQIELLASVIKSSGWTNPCLIADGGILAGHGRIMAAKKLGLKKVPCIDLSHLSEVERRALVISDNRVAEVGVSWDIEMLKLETDWLQEQGFDLELTGFDEDSLAELFGEAEQVPEGSDKDPDEAPAAPEQPVSVPGDVWVCGAHKVMCGSSLSVDDWDRLMQGEMADACWTDPPYNVDIGGKNEMLDRGDRGNRGKTGGIKNDKMDGEAFHQFLLDMYSAVFSVMKPGAPIYVAHADKEAHNFRVAFEKAGFKFSSMIIWKKNVLVLGMSDYQPIHEPVIYGWKPGSKHRWYGGRKNTTVIDMGDSGPFVRMEDGRYQIKIGDSVLIVSGEAMVEEHLSSVLFEAKPAKSGLHPTQKPVALVERMLKQSARSGDLVVDAFGGSGTTMLAADRLGMSARLMELDPRFVDVIVCRWEQYTGRRAVHAVTGEQFPAEGEARQAQSTDSIFGEPTDDDIF